MSGFVAFILFVQGLVFAFWTFLMFRALFGIQRRYHATTGKILIGPFAVFSVFGAYLKDPTYRKERHLILAVLVLLIFLTALFAISRG